MVGKRNADNFARALREDQSKTAPGPEVYEAIFQDIAEEVGLSKSACYGTGQARISALLSERAHRGRRFRNWMSGAAAVAAVLLLVPGLMLHTSPSAVVIPDDPIPLGNAPRTSVYEVTMSDNAGSYEPPIVVGDDNGVLTIYLHGDISVNWGTLAAGDDERVTLAVELLQEDNAIRVSGASSAVTVSLEDMSGNTLTYRIVKQA